ncbi:carboxylate--amine ligase/circularly permuted type 2 ATP-grasp protein [Rhodococcus coprophilus]|uniref:carboxylate--amine ligase/circularly permuted type 2 ATP-grasp protein n=1 Tax=Rhodococcus coprophilus TaxID=38310 RepID=UPI0033EBBF97
MVDVHPRQIGVEEEFQLIDVRTRRLAPRAPQLLARLSDVGFVAEMQRCVVEANSAVHTDLAALRTDLKAKRALLVSTAATMGLGVAAAGSAPLGVPEEIRVSDTPRFHRMLTEYQLLAREQLICGTQVHVEISDRDEAVRVAHRITPHLPLFLALSASSPFWPDGSDTGYASVRPLMWIRWPTTGPSPPVSSAAEYDRLVADLVSSGAITDPGMVYFDVRPSSHLPTLELRVCDSCPSVDTITLVTGLYRALVDREVAVVRAGDPPPVPSPTLVRAAMWRAARSGVEGDLVDLDASLPRPAADILARFLATVRPQLEDNGDWELVTQLAADAVERGSSSARQRRVLRRRGKMTDVVDHLLAETAGHAEPSFPGGGSQCALLHGYPPTRHGAPYDEAIGSDGVPRSHYLRPLQSLARLGATTLRMSQDAIAQTQSAEKVTFRPRGEGSPQPFPMDVVPRIVTAAAWQGLQRALEQRVTALNAFLVDIYGRREILAAGVLPPEVLDIARGYRSTGDASHGRAVRAHVAAVDLACTGPDRFVVLEDHLRNPTGIGYALAHRAMTQRFLDDLWPATGIVGVDGTPELIFRTLADAAPPAAGDEVTVAVLGAGARDPGWFEHVMLADRAGVELVQTDELVVRDDVVYIQHGPSFTRVDVLYSRIDEETLLSSTGYDGRPLRSGLLGAVRAGTLTLANALGNGVGDDRSVYRYVPAMIEYYLGQRPLLDQVFTWVCADPAQRDHVLTRLDELVVRPVDGGDGAEIMVGPEAGSAELERRHLELLTHPERFVAHELVTTSTHPTFDGDGLYPRHVDLRAFVYLRPDRTSVRAEVAPALLTRVAPTGSAVVDSSRGGGTKDTWILEPPEG